MSPHPPSRSGTNPIRREVFKPLHPPNTLEDNLRPDQKLGPVDPTTVIPKAPRPLTEDEKRVRAAREDMPALDSLVNLQDFEELAEKVLSRTAWAYYRSAGTCGGSDFRGGRRAD